MSGHYPVTRCKSPRCAMPVFFAPTARGGTGIYDAKIPAHATERTQRIWLDREGIARVVSERNPAPPDRAQYTNHFQTCRDVARFAGEAIATRKDRGPLRHVDDGR